MFGFGAAFSDDTDYPEVDIFLLFKVINKFALLWGEAQKKIA